MKTTTLNPDLVAAYRWHRQQRMPFGGTASACLSGARLDVLAGKKRYPHSARYSAPGARFDGYGTKSMRWCESPADIGLRFVGYADNLARIDHRGWFTDEFQDSTVRGVVYQLPARNVRPVYVSGYDNADNGAAESGGPAAIDFGTIWLGDPGGDYAHDNGLPSRDAAYHADKLAERMAEKEREYQAASSAGFAWAQKGEEVAEIRRDTLALLAERRAAKAAGDKYPTLCSTIAAAIESGLKSIAKLRSERDKLASGDGLGRDSVHAFWAGDKGLREAFNEGAGSQVLA